MQKRLVLFSVCRKEMRPFSERARLNQFKAVSPKGAERFSKDVSKELSARSGSPESLSCVADQQVKTFIVFIF